MEREKDALINRANSLKRAIRSLVEHTEQVVDEQNRQSTSAIPTVKISLSCDLDKTEPMKMDSLKVMPTIDSGGSSDVSSYPSPTSSILTARLANISPMPDVRRDSAFGSDDTDLLTLPVPADFADSRRASQIQQQQQSAEITTEILIETAQTLVTIEIEQKPIEEEIEKETDQQQRRDSTKSELEKNVDDEKRV
ncbi:hypothetical protein NQ318_011027 [Aromia moschata]|uniref:Uncharacterized protein n=1 Tax=Aromia moschata TaxID=1265417 RepID=A0AAV8YTI2_9CUCU|nr:hypothetical protein NQ318_011027 [Aromia moschata]